MFQYIYIWECQFKTQYLQNSNVLPQELGIYVNMSPKISLLIMHQLNLYWKCLIETFHFLWPMSPWLWWFYDYDHVYDDYLHFVYLHLLVLLCIPVMFQQCYILLNFDWQELYLYLSLWNMIDLTWQGSASCHPFWGKILSLISLNLKFTCCNYISAICCDGYDLSTKW